MDAMQGVKTKVMNRVVSEALVAGGRLRVALYPANGRQLGLLTCGGCRYP